MGPWESLQLCSLAMLNNGNNFIHVVVASVGRLDHHVDGLKHYVSLCHWDYLNSVEFLCASFRARISLFFSILVHSFSISFDFCCCKVVCITYYIYARTWTCRNFVYFFLCSRY